MDPRRYGFCPLEGSLLLLQSQGDQVTLIQVGTGSTKLCSNSIHWTGGKATNRFRPLERFGSFHEICQRHLDEVHPLRPCSRLSCLLCVCRLKSEECLQAIPMVSKESLELTCIVAYKPTLDHPQLQVLSSRSERCTQNPKP